MTCQCCSFKQEVLGRSQVVVTKLYWILQVFHVWLLCNITRYVNLFDGRRLGVLFDGRRLGVLFDGRWLNVLSYWPQTFLAGCHLLCEELGFSFPQLTILMVPWADEPIKVCLVVLNPAYFCVVCLHLFTQLLHLAVVLHYCFRQVMFKNNPTARSASLWCDEWSLWLLCQLHLWFTRMK